MKIITWDYKEKPNVDEINAALDSLMFGRLFSVETDSDEFAIVVAEHDTLQESAQRAFDQRFDYDHE